MKVKELVDKQIEKAARYNAERFNHSVMSPSLKRTLVQLTASFQIEEGLEVDGMYGPKTDAALKTVFDDDNREQQDTPSNSVIVNGSEMQLPPELVNKGVVVTNYRHDGEAVFKHAFRDPEDVDFFVLHETCGPTKERCVETLQRESLGVQLILAPDGKLSQHGDLLAHKMSHAGGFNRCSFGIEVVNPYAPGRNKVHDTPFTRKIRAQWWTWCPDKNDRSYVLPTQAQLRTLELVTPWLCEITGVPFEFPTDHLSARRPRINKTDLKRHYRGIVAHRDFEPNRSDGRYLLEYLADQR